jgi:phospholipid/cholesterol/gamma-HCH transport system substrate-binding protein
MNEQAKVGLLVLVAGAILLVTIFSMTDLGTRGRYVEYKMFLEYAGGLEPGAAVRYGGLRVGRVDRVGVAPGDRSRIEIDIAVRRDTEIPVDSTGGISQLGFLGENYIEIQPGSSPESLPPGSVIPSREIEDIGTLMRRLNAVAESAEPLVADLHRNLNNISAELDVVLKNVQGMTGPENQKRLNNVLANADRIMETTAPRLETITTNFEQASHRLNPLIAELQGTTQKMDQLMTELNAVVAENRGDIRTSMEQLARTLDGTRELMLQLNAALSSNTGNLEAIMVNVQDTTQNLREFSDTIRQQPSSLLRGAPRPQREVPPLTGTGGQRGGSNQRQGGATRGGGEN